MTSANGNSDSLSTENGPIDSRGAAIGAVRMDPSQAYTAIPGFLTDVINDNSVTAWDNIRSRIDYIHHGLSCALGALEAETGFSRKILETSRGA